jgi:hypothetical protein
MQYQRKFAAAIDRRGAQTYSPPSITCWPVECDSAFKFLISRFLTRIGRKPEKCIRFRSKIAPSARKVAPKSPVLGGRHRQPTLIGYAREAGE